MSGPESEDQTTAPHGVEESQQELREALGDLEGIVQSSVNPAVWVTKRPLPWLLGGFVLGLWLGTRG